MSGIALELALRRALFRRGERFSFEVALHNRGAETITLTDPADLSNDQIVYTLAGSAEQERVGLGSVRPSLELEPGRSLRADVLIGEWGDLGPGDYTLWARLSPKVKMDGKPVLSNVIAFRIFEPKQLQIAWSTGSYEEVPDAGTVHVAAIGEKGAVLFGHPLLPHSEHLGRYDLAAAHQCFTPERPPLHLLPVASSRPACQWLVWTDEHGIVARAIDPAVEGAAELSLTAPLLPLGPVLEQDDGAALVYVVSGPERQLLGCRFAPPRSIVEEAEGPDDWDDEVLVAGSAESLAFGTLPFTATQGAVHD